MIRGIILCLVIGILSFGALAEEDLAGRFVPAGDDVVVEPGDIFKATIQLMPHSSRKDYSRYEKIEGKPFLNFFYTIKIDSIAPSVNNTDVLEIKGDFALRKPFGEKGIYIWSIEDENIPFEVRGIRSKAPNDKSPKKLLVAEQSYHSDYKINYILIVSALATAMVVTLFGVKLLIRRRRQTEKRLAKQAELMKWHEKFVAAETRADYESIYTDKKIWLSILGVETPQIHTFFKIINSKQYQPEWSEEELYDVATAFDDIREIMKSKNGI